jgi:hypothetical protein
MREEFSEEKGLGMQMMGQAMKFAGGIIDIYHEGENKEKEKDVWHKLQTLAIEADTLFKEYLALVQEKKTLSQTFLEKHSWLQDTITTLNKTAPQARSKKQQAVSLTSACSSNPAMAKVGKATAEGPGLQSRFKTTKELLALQGGERILLNGPLGSFLGRLERKSLAMTITGPPGQGKTHFTFILSKAFCEKKLKVMFFSLEEGNGGSFGDKMRQYGLDAEEEYFYSVDKADLSLLEEAAGEFDVIILDSWTVMGEKNETFGSFVSKYPQVIFVSIFQQTTSGEIRGGSQPIYDSSINLEVKNGVVYNRKNRYGGKGEYQIFPAL